MVLTFDTTLYLLALFPPLIGGRRGVGVWSESLLSVPTSWSPRVLGGVVLSEAASPSVPNVVDDLLCRDSLELDPVLFLDLFECENLRRCENMEGIANVYHRPRSLLNGRLL